MWKLLVQLVGGALARGNDSSNRLGIRITSYNVCYTKLLRENDYVTEDKTAPILDIDADSGIWEDGYYVGTGETILSNDSLQLDFVEPVMAGTGNVVITSYSIHYTKLYDFSNTRRT